MAVLETVKKSSAGRRFNRKELMRYLKLAFESRLISKTIRSEVLTGKAKFGIESAGKELWQIVLAKYFQEGDYYSGYYRDQTFLMAKDLATPESILMNLYGDVDGDPYNSGRLMNGHFATPFIGQQDEYLTLTNKYNISAALSPLAGHLPKALGLALSSKLYRNRGIVNDYTQAGNEVVVTVIGDGTAAEGIFYETFNAACVEQVPMIFVVQDDGYGISVPTELQTSKGSISDALAGFQRMNKNERACEIYKVRGWNYEELNQTFRDAMNVCRSESVPVLIHVHELTQLNGHSTSGSHERYKTKERLDWEQEMDCLLQFERFLIDNNITTQNEIADLKITWAKEIATITKQTWKKHQRPFNDAKAELGGLLMQLDQDVDAVASATSRMRLIHHGALAKLMTVAADVIMRYPNDYNQEQLSTLKNWYIEQKEYLSQTYGTNLQASADVSPTSVAVVKATYADDAPMVKGYEVLNAFFDQLLERNDSVVAFGEDLGKIGGVNQCFAGLQKKYGVDRVWDTGIREWTIVGEGIGLSMRGFRPIAEIQYLDYLVYALPALTDELATLRWRTNNRQAAPVIIRTRGHRLEGIWHSGSPMSMLLGSLRGVHLLTPRNMTQAAGMYNTLMQGDDPAVLIECLNGYRKKEMMPDNLDTFTVPLGSPEILREGSDVTIVTYGSCVTEAESAATFLEDHDVDVELIDVQTLLPFDIESTIVQSLKKTNKVIFLDEDVPGGGTAYMMQKVLEEQGGYDYLDAQPVTITSTEHRTAYGDNGNMQSKPHAIDVVEEVLKMMAEYQPAKYSAMF
jgi:pyruvate/2-oxoglutarate/acetoin dehydrogenase E1 component/TPP-dependent pyruvate/acetoin dehydrogenase alpha subunit